MYFKTPTFNCTCVYLNAKAARSRHHVVQCSEDLAWTFGNQQSFVGQLPDAALNKAKTKYHKKSHSHWCVLCSKLFCFSYAK